jgi:hypothetical protein
MNDSMPSELIFERSLARTAGLLAAAILMTGMSYFFLTRRIFPIAFEAWLLGILLGPVGVVINLLALFRGGPQVVFDEHGINDLRTSWGLIPWTDILSFAIVSIYANRVLCIYLVDESARVARLSTWGRLALLFKMRFVGLAPGLNEAWHYLATHHPEKVFAAPPAPALTNVRP